MRFFFKENLQNVFKTVYNSKFCPNSRNLNPVGIKQDIYKYWTMTSFNNFLTWTINKKKWYTKQNSWLVCLNVGEPNFK